MPLASQDLVLAHFQQNCGRFVLFCSWRSPFAKAPKLRSELVQDGLAAPVPA
jgi:hypothetical protein